MQDAGAGHPPREAAEPAAFCAPVHPLDQSSGVLKEIITEPTQL